MSKHVNLDTVDFYVDVTYGVLLFIGIMSMLLFTSNIAAVTFGVGVLLGYAVHIAWRMARFDPDAERVIEDTIEDTVESKVDEIEDTVEQTVEETVEEHVE